MRLNANFHTHSTFCDGRSTPRENTGRALELGFTALGFSGHMDQDVSMDLPAYTREIRALQAEFADRLTILCGLEVDVLYDPACTKGMDYIIGSTHFLDVQYERSLAVDSTAEDMKLLCDTFYGGDYYALSRDYYRLEAEAYDRLHCTFIGHFDLLTKFNDQMGMLDESSIRYLGPALEAMEHLVRQGVPFEINTKQSQRGKLCPGPILLKHLHDMGGEILINSDAHCSTELDRGFPLALDAARKAGFDHVNLLTRQQGRVGWKTLAID